MRAFAMHMTFYVGSADVIVGVHVVSPSFKLGLALTLNDTILITFFFFHTL